MGQERGAIRLPRGSGSDRRDAYVKLLSRVDPHAWNGFGFEGRFFKCGKWVSEAELRPTAEYPEIPVLLESSIGRAVGEPGHRRRLQLYVLWRWSPADRAWEELGRAQSFSWEWALDLRPLALRALEGARGAPLEVEAEPTHVIEIAAGITKFLDKRLDTLEPPERIKLLGILHDHFAARSGT